VKEELKFLGNKDLLKSYKVGFLCSRKVPSKIILKTYDWAVEQREKGNCVVSGFHSKIEKDVFHYLIKGNQPIILVLARGLYKVIPKILQVEIEKQKLLIISPFRKEISRVSEETAVMRNRLIIEISNELYVPYIDKNGNLQRLLDTVDTNKKIM
jgi:predicted Rossmann fold nucleotide-binding protein DprA/Smf involved in DNA uptake